jgi:hypothetical protein
LRLSGLSASRLYSRAASSNASNGTRSLLYVAIVSAANGGLQVIEGKRRLDIAIVNKDLMLSATLQCPNQQRRQAAAGVDVGEGAMGRAGT